MTRKPDPQAASSLFLGALGILVVILAVVSLRGVFYGMEEAEWASKNLPGLGEEAGLLRRSQQSRLQSYARSEREKGVLIVPIERAMELVVEEYGR